MVQKTVECKLFLHISQAGVQVVYVMFQTKGGLEYLWRTNHSFQPGLVARLKNKF